MIPVLHIEIPLAKRRKCDQFRFIPNCNNSQQEYQDDEQLHKQPSRKPTSVILEKLSKHGRFLLRCHQRELTHQRTAKEFNEEVVTDDYHVYHSEWLRMRSTKEVMLQHFIGKELKC
jgi:hypothetical protein